ncbi:MAG: PEGA domain-containing protein [Planctomycetota bacterium]|nr:PEGA domain-containing protein [Planctomycetota bacterium]
MLFNYTPWSGSLRAAAWFGAPFFRRFIVLSYPPYTTPAARSDPMPRSRIMKWLAVVCLVLPLLLFAEEPEAVYKQGIAKLRDAQSDHAALVPATKLLAQAAALYEAAGDEAKTTEINSCLYWAKKKMTLADTEAVKGDAVAVQRIETVAKAIPASEAKTMLDKAEAFAKGRADDPLLISIRFFEIADRFPDAPEGKKAMQQSLAAMQKVGEKAKLETYKPAPTDGKAFIKSEPVGAAIVLVMPDGGKLDTGKVTPALIQLPVGRQSLELTLKGRKAATLAVEVDGKAIAKPEATTLEPLTVAVDVIFEDAWTVFVDGKPARAVGTGKAETPCTVELPLGRHELGLAKDGFMDVRQQVEAVEGGVKAAGGIPKNSFEGRSRPNRGTSSLLASPQASVMSMNLLSTVNVEKDAISGTWAMSSSGLSGSAANYGRLQFSCSVPEEYDLRAVFTRKEGNDCMYLFFPSMGKGCMYVLGGNSNKMYGFVGGVEKTAIAGSVLQTGKKHEALLEVRKEKITGYLDGKVMLKADANAGGGSIPVRLKDETRIGVGTWGSQFLFHTVELTAPPPPKPGK